MTTPDGAETPPASPLATERARLRAAGYTDDEISKIFVAREVAASSSPAGAAAPAGPAPHVPMSGASGSVGGVWAFLGGLIPAAVAQVVTVFNHAAAPSARLSALLSLMVKGAVVWVVVYVAMLEITQLRVTVYAMAQPVEAVDDDPSARPLFPWESPPSADTPLPPDQQQERERRLVAEHAKGQGGIPCNPKLAPYLKDTILVPTDDDTQHQPCVLPDDMNTIHWTRPPPSGSNPQ